MKLGDNMTMEACNMWGDVCPRKCRPPRIGDIPKHGAVDEESPGSSTKKLTISPTDPTDSVESGRDVGFSLGTANSPSVFQAAPNDLTAIADEQYASGKSFHKIHESFQQETHAVPQQAKDALGKPFYVTSDILRKSPSPPRHLTERKQQGTDAERTAVDANNRVTIKLSATSTASLTRKLVARSPTVEQPEGTRLPSSPDEASDTEIREVRKDSALFLEEAEGLPTLREILKNRAPRIIRPRRESSGYASNLGTFDEDRRNSSTADILQDLSSFLKERRRSSTKRLNSRTALGRTEDSLGEEINVGQACVSDRMPTTEINRKISSAGLEMPNIEEVKELQREEASSRQESLDDLCTLVDNVNINELPARCHLLGQPSNHKPASGNDVRPCSKDLTKSMTPVTAEFLVSEDAFSVTSLQKTVVCRVPKQDATGSSVSSECLPRQCSAVSAKSTSEEDKSVRTFGGQTQGQSTKILTQDVTGSSTSGKRLSRQCSAVSAKSVLGEENSARTLEDQSQDQKTKTSTQDVLRLSTSDRHPPQQSSVVNAKSILEEEKSTKTIGYQSQGEKKKDETDRPATTKRIRDQQHERSSAKQSPSIENLTRIVQENLTPGYRESGTASNADAEKAKGSSQDNEQASRERQRQSEETVKLDEGDRLINSRKCSAQPLNVSKVSTSLEAESGAKTLQESARDHREKCRRHDERAKLSKADRPTTSSAQASSLNIVRASANASSNLQNVQESISAPECTDKHQDGSDRLRTNQETNDLRPPSVLELSTKLSDRQSLKQSARNDGSVTLDPQNEPNAVYSRSVKMYQLLSTQSEDRADGELHLADRRISLQIPRQDDDTLPIVSASDKSMLHVSGSRYSQLESDVSSRNRDSTSTESSSSSPARKLSSPGEVGVHHRHLGDATSVSVRPIYPYCPYSPYGSPQGSPRNRRRPLRESRRVSIDNKQGELQLNQYKLLDNIGQGSYGIVKLAYNEEDETHYAMKILSKKKLMKKAGIFGRMAPGRKGAVNPLAKVYREIALLKKLDHPNVVKLVEVLDDPDEDNLYLVFELVEKGEVLQIPTDKPLDEDTARKNFRDVVMGVEYLHYQRIVHRDIKPSNLLVDSEGRIKIADLGVSAELRASGELLSGPAGTPAFAAPETTTPGAHYSGTLCDVWSMGVTLYSLVTGRVPWDGAGSIIGVQAAVRSEPLKFPEKPALSNDLRNIISRMLAKDPSERIVLPKLKEHCWLTNNGKEPLPSEADNCRLPVTVTDEEVERVVTRVPKLDTLILIKTMLKQHSFQNPFLPKRAGRTNCNDADTSALELSPSGRMVGASAHRDTIKNVKTDRFHRVGRSNSAPDSYNWQTNGRQISVESPLPPVTEASSQESEIEKR